MTSYQTVMANIQAKAVECGRSADEITVIAVSKNYPLATMQSAYQEGARDFGESRMQEALTKIPQMPQDCRWHLIGTLQSNKVTKAVGVFHLIHSVDTLELAQKISEASEERGVVTSILLQVNTSGEAAKHGLSQEEWRRALPEVNQLNFIKCEGLMTIAPLTEDQGKIRKCFRTLRELRNDWRSRMRDPESFRHLSMGMSYDYLTAIEEGATLVRIGTAIFH